MKTIVGIQLGHGDMAEQASAISVVEEDAVSVVASFNAKRDLQMKQLGPKPRTHCIEQKCGKKIEVDFLLEKPKTSRCRGCFNAFLASRGN